MLKVYRELKGCHGVCKIYHYGVQDPFNVLVMDLLGPSLEDCFNKCDRKFSLKTLLQIADQLLDRMSMLFSRLLNHRDIKPGNFAVGRGDNRSLIYCVDFGMSKRFRDPHTGKHIPYVDGKSLAGRVCVCVCVCVCVIGRVCVCRVGIVLYRLWRLR